MNQPGDEKRHFQRILCSGRVEVAGVTDPGELIDLSLKGLLLAPAGGWSPRVGSDCTVAVRLEGCATPIRMETRVAHVEADQVGLCCLRIDLDGIGALRRLVELNLADPAELERELEALGS